jgi:hypothetical protein
MLNSQSHTARCASVARACRCAACSEKAPAAAFDSNSTRGHPWRRLLPALLACVAISTAASPAASTDFPNFMGDHTTGWVPDRPTGDDFLPPPSGPGPVMSRRDRPYVPNGQGRQPTYRLADLTNPILTPWAIERMREANDVVLANKVPFIAREHCWPAGVPGFTVFTRVQPIHFIQTPTKVIIVNELNAEVRRVHLNVLHSPEPKPSWYGESIGRYEGDELVVDTIGLNDRTYVDNYRTPHTNQIHVVERFKLQALVTVTDPGAFNTPWSALQRWRLVDRPLVENLCAENNLDPFGYDDHPVPQAATPDF